jgi:hypothetical protein
MDLEYVPLLPVMRDLHRIPRGQPPDFNGKRRFKQYLRTIFDGEVFTPPRRAGNRSGPCIRPAGGG